MLVKLQYIVRRYFDPLVSQLGFTRSSEECDGEYYETKYQAHDIGIGLEKYRRELELCLFKSSKPDKEINLFVLVEFLDRESKESVKSNYFPHEKDLDESFRLQIEWLARVLKMYLSRIHEFFSDELYDQNVSELSGYVVKKHPELYARR